MGKQGHESCGQFVQDVQHGSYPQTIHTPWERFSKGLLPYKTLKTNGFYGKSLFSTGPTTNKQST
jgi:hypothetical protein